ncbi:hypothetical protein [Nocardiopsis sp. MG754419]|uniref:hypothetical protein n=1 Tax=Nocardiopsis sp. MG754419 TaxID=2259865 RepID=UPI001BA5B19B|nr:hypothetical protein [Nocardiopsis sp. MG754419]MBR8743918.1 hypothetical protein [Nocardiopsis sp. MG754419]
MTGNTSFEQRVRERMAKTGESRTAARAHLLPTAPSPGTGASPMRDRVSDARVAEATGRGYDAWFALLDTWEGTTRTHTRIAAHLVEEHGVDGWWAQTVTVGYEQERGLRAPGQKKDGFALSASKTVNVPVERLFEAFADPELRQEWLPLPVHERAATAGRRFTADLPEGTRVAVTFQAKGENKSLVGVEHTRIDSAERAAEWKADWRTRLTDMKRLLEG